MYDFSELTGNVILPDHPNYDAARQEYNAYFNYYLLVIVFCNNNVDVKNAIRWARKNHVNVRPRSGRHSYEAYSVGDDVLVLDVSQMKNYRFDRTHDTITMQAGLTNGEAYDIAQKNGYQFIGSLNSIIGVAGAVTTIFTHTQ